MTDDEERSFYSNHFEPAWKKFSKDETLDYDKTPAFWALLAKKVE